MTSRHYRYAAAAVVALGVALRLRRAWPELVGPPTRPVPALRWERVPLYQLLDALVPGPAALLPILLGALTLVAVLELGRRGPGRGHALVAGALAAALPSAVLVGSTPWTGALQAALVTGTTLALVAAVESPSTRTGGWLFAAALALLLTNWTAWPPVLAWLAWLTFLRPADCSTARARAGLVALGAAAGLAAAVYGVLLLRGVDPPAALGRPRPRLGEEALGDLLDAFSGLLGGQSRGLSLASRLTLAAAAVGLPAAGLLRLRGDARLRRWKGVVAMGSLGALLPALILHPWIPTAGIKSLWTLSPLLPLLMAGLLPRRAPLAALAALTLVGCTDADGDGHYAERDDCDDSDPSAYEGAPDLWGDGVDNDCDGAPDSADSYVFRSDEEPNDALLGDCFAPAGQALGLLAPRGELSRIDGRLDEVVDEAYDEGDMDCFALRLPPDTEPAYLRVTLEWDEPDADLDFALQGLWEGEQRGFIQGSAPGPGPESYRSSAAFEASSPLWLWVIAYRGPPTDYRADLVLR